MAGPTKPPAVGQHSPFPPQTPGRAPRRLSFLLSQSWHGRLARAYLAGTAMLRGAWLKIACCFVTASLRQPPYYLCMIIVNGIKTGLLFFILTGLVLAG